MKVVVIGGGWSGCAVHLKRHQKKTRKKACFFILNLYLTHQLHPKLYNL